MILSLLSNLLILGMIIFFVNRIFSRGHRQASKGGEVRRFFQFGLLFALTIISGVGLSGLLGRLLHIGVSLSTDRGALALESSFTVVGIPLLYFVATWARKTLTKDPSERDTFGWNLYLTATSIMALALNLVAQLKIFKVIFADGVLQGSAISQFVVWGAIWFVHFRLHNQIRNPLNTTGDHLLGSLIGLGFSVVGLLTILEALLTSLFRFNAGSIIVTGNHPLTEGLITLIVGVPVWYVYWIRTASKSEKDSLWFAYVLLIGVGGGLLVAVTAASFSLYSLLVWFIGDPAAQTASVHFNDSPGSVAAALVGLLVMWYHREILSNENADERTDIRRIYEYGIAGIGLLAAAGGFTMILVSIIESLSGSVQISGGGSINSLLAAITLIIVGGPIWWFMWRSVQIKAELNPASEHSSLIRRIYLFILFGVLGVVSVAMLILGAYFIFKDLFQQGIGLETLRRIRFPIAILLTTGVVSVYHWLIFRGEKDVEIARSGPKPASSKTYLFIEISVEPEKQELFLEELNKYALLVSKENGCEDFEILTDPKLRGRVYIYEIWRDRDAWDVHMKREESLLWQEKVKPLVYEQSMKVLNSA